MKTTPSLDIASLAEIPLRMRDRDPKLIGARYKSQNKWVDITWPQYYSQIEAFGLGLKELGVEKGDRVAIFANTRFEWCVADFAAIGIGAIVVPIYQTMTGEDLRYILEDCGAKILILENKATFRVFEAIRERCPAVKTVISIETLLEPKSPVTSWASIMQKGQESLSKNTNGFANLCREVKISDVATILYTSGTTGLPKGVVLTHLQAVSEIHDAFHYVGANKDDITLTFLPYAHILGRIEHWGQSYIGFQIAFAESIDKIRQNLGEIRPTIMVAVPRIFEKFYTAIWSQVESNPVSNRLFRWAVAVGLKVGDYRLRREAIPFALLAEYKLAQKFALNKVKDSFGGRLRFAISGGAPIAKDIALFFHACEILILEGYGLTETTAAITVNAPFDYRFGSVGKPFGDVEIKIASDGEILIRSDKIMKEYYHNPEATREAITDGWFHTGDIGEIIPSGDLRITDRKKDLIKTAGGKYVAPQHLENLLKTHSIISQVLIHGDQKKFIVALITLEKAAILQLAKEKQLSYADYASLTQSAPVLELVRKAVAETNSHLASFETIKRFAVLPQDFTMEAGELTPSLKIKRKFVDKKFAAQIEALYR